MKPRREPFNHDELECERCHERSITTERVVYEGKTERMLCGLCIEKIYYNKQVLADEGWVY